MTTFFTADTHFSHARILELDNRPFKTIEEHDEELIRRWNETVSPDDTVIHLGDVALGKIADSLPLVGRLNGFKILKSGNHDRTFAGNKQKERDRFLPIYEQYFDEVDDGGKTEPWMVYIDEDDYFHPVVMSHFPHDSDHTSDIRYEQYRPDDDGRILICGHTHEKEPVQHSKKGTLQIHVSVTAWDFRPVSEHQIAQLISENMEN